MALRSPSAEQLLDAASAVYLTVVLCRSHLPAGLQEPTLVRLLTYLLRLHQVHRATLTESQLQEQELVDRLLLSGKDAAPFPCEGGLSSFREADIQALIHCAGASRREAMEALRRCNGDVQQAFSQELSRLRLDRVLLGQLLEEYVVFRGLQLPEPAAHCKTGSSSSGSATASGAAPWVPLPCSEAAAAAAPGTDAPAAGNSGHEPMDMILGAAHHQGSGLQPSGQDAAGAGDRAASHAAAGTSGPCATHPSVRQNLHILHPDRSDTQSPPTKVPRCSASGVSAQPSLLGSILPAAAPSSPHRPVDARLRELPHVVNDLAKEGQVPQVIQAVQQLDPSFFDAHPQLLFELRRCEFLQLLDAGDTTKALHFTRTQLAPAAERHEALQPALKATTAMLLGVGQREPAAAALQTAAGNLQAALRVHMGMHGPQLIRLLQVLLAVHRAWLRREKFNDPFQAALAIDALRDLNAAPVATAMTALTSAQQRNDAELTSLPDLSLASSDEEDRQAAVDEERVLRVMEVLEIPRRTALDLLVHHDGDVEAAIMSSL